MGKPDQVSVHQAEEMRLAVCLCALLAVSIALEEVQEMAAEEAGLLTNKQGGGALPTKKPAPIRTGCPTVAQAYHKFLGRMKAVEKLQGAAEARANKAEATAHKQAEAATRCLDANKLLSAPAQAARSKIRAYVTKKLAKAQASCRKTALKLKIQCKQEVASAKHEEQTKQNDRFKVEFRKVQLQAKTEVAKCTTKLKLAHGEATKKKVTHGARVTKLVAELAASRKQNMPAVAAAARARAESKHEFEDMVTANKRNSLAVRTLSAQLKTKGTEVESCRKALGSYKPHAPAQQAIPPPNAAHMMATLAKGPSITKVSVLENKVKNLKATAANYKQQATQHEANAGALKSQLAAANNRIHEIELALKAKDAKLERMQAWSKHQSHIRSISKIKKREPAHQRPIKAAQKPKA